MHIRAAIISLIGLSFSVQAWAQEPLPLGTSDCYDMKISARPVEQIPSDATDCGENCIVMRWPWFVDLTDIRVLDGPALRKRVRVLTIQHSYLVDRIGIWWLRHNSTGGFNALHYADNTLPRCPTDAKDAAPYLRPANGQTLDDIYRSLKRKIDEDASSEKRP